MTGQAEAVTAPANAATVAGQPEIVVELAVSVHEHAVTVVGQGEEASAGQAVEEQTETETVTNTVAEMVAAETENE